MSLNKYARIIYAGLVAEITATVPPKYRIEVTDRLWDLARVVGRHDPRFPYVYFPHIGIVEKQPDAWKHAPSYTYALQTAAQDYGPLPEPPSKTASPEPPPF